MLIIVVLVIAVGALTCFQQKSNSNSDAIAQSTTLPQSTNQQKIQTYTGFLVSFNYLTSQTNGVESTQLVFTNTTFNYPIYISIDNNCIYNITYYDNNPNQALSVTKINLTIGLAGNTEQVAITNVQFTPSSPDNIKVLVQNSGTSCVNFAQAFINGVTVTMNPSSASLTESTSGTITLTLPPSTSLSPGMTYAIKFTKTIGT